MSVRLFHYAVFTPVVSKRSLNLALSAITSLYSNQAARSTPSYEVGL